jgi:hypothetical protein
MSAWVIIVGVWAVCALSAVLFIRGSRSDIAGDDNDARDAADVTADEASGPGAVPVQNGDHGNV